MERIMKQTVLLTCAAAGLFVALGSISANATPIIDKSDIGWSKSVQKADWNDRPYGWRHHRRWDRDDWRGRWWWRRHRSWDRDDWRWHRRDRDWDDRGWGDRR